MPDWVLPWPRVTTNSLYRRTRNGVRLSDRALAWRDEAIVIVRQATVFAEGLPEGRLAFTLRAWQPRDGRRHDGDNLLKLTVDSICAAYRIDDSRIREWHVYQHQTGPGWEPRLQARLQLASWQGDPLAPTDIDISAKQQEVSQ